jgi:hypothetical protein
MAPSAHPFGRVDRETSEISHRHVESSAGIIASESRARDALAGIGTAPGRLRGQPGVGGYLYFLAFSIGGAGRKHGGAPYGTLRPGLSYLTQRGCESQPRHL